MLSKKRLTIDAMLAAAGIAAANWGCGSGALPPPSSVSVSVSQTTATVSTGATAQFTATVENDPSNKGVGWSVSCSAASCGTVSPTSTASGAATTYKPPASPATNLRVNLTATSASDPTKTGTVTITVLPAIAASVFPVFRPRDRGETATLTAMLTNGGTNKELPRCS